MKVVLETSPVLEYAVDMEPVLETSVDHVEPELIDLSIWYPVIADPPLFDGAVQDRLICDDETAVAIRLVGGCDMVTLEGGVTNVVADAVLDGELVPTALIADTR